MENGGRALAAIRYVILRRLAPGLCHKMFGSAQTIQFATELCRRKLSASGSIPELEPELSKVAAHAMEMTSVCRSLADWLRPNDSSPAHFGEAARACIDLMDDDWMLRGISSTLEIAESAEVAPVSRSIACELISASILALIDSQGDAINIDFAASAIDRQVAVSIISRPSGRKPMLPPRSDDDKLSWEDIRLLAEIHDVAAAFDSTSASITLALEQKIPVSAS